MTQLCTKHAAAYDEAEKKGDKKQCNWGINSTTCELVDMDSHNIWESFSVKGQIIKTAIESICMIL